MAVSGSRIGADVPEPVSIGSPGGDAGVPGAPGDEGVARGGAGDVGRGRTMKHDGPALRWLACAAVGLPVVFA